MRESLRLLRPTLPAWLLLALPRAALACPVCTGGQSEEVGMAFFTGSVFLSVLPLAAIGAAVWWIRRRARALANDGAALPERAG